MAITYHAGRRIQGTNADRTTNYGTVSTDGSYTVLKFTESGVFKPTSAFNVEYLVVAGGGAGGKPYGGGGGAGGLRTNRSGATNGGGSSLESTYGVTAQTYTITVGAGGVAPSATHVTGNSGSNSSIVPASGTSIISNGGGGGGAEVASRAGLAGGSSGGSGYAVAGVAALTSPTVQGYASGTGGNGDTYGYSGGGGGGAGEVGQGAATQTAKTGLDGGDGVQNDITGASIYYAGGGAGSGGYGSQDLTYQGDGGLGGGGNGAYTGKMYAEDGADGLGGGGSGTPNGSTISNLGAGGDGVVILRFLTSGNTYTDTRIPNVQVGSRYEETDTRKIYYRDDIDFKELDGNEATNYRSASWYEQLSGETP